MKKKIAATLLCMFAALAVTPVDATCIIEGSLIREAASTCESSIHENLVAADRSCGVVLLERLERAEWTSEVSDAAELRLKFNFYMIIR